MTNFINLSGKTALISGSGRGLGATTAQRLAELGANIIINDVNAANAKEVASYLEENILPRGGAAVLVSTHDISSLKEAEDLVMQAQKKFGRIDILANNAGIIRDGMLHKLSEEAWDDVIRVNLKGVFNLGQMCARLMRENKYGRIINFSSTSRFGNLGQSNYAAAKAGVVGLTRTWAMELARYGITVNAIAPGVIDTEMSRSIPPEIKEKVIRRIPLGKVGDPGNVADLVAFLASDRASYITGQSIQIDGGFSVGINLD